MVTNNTITARFTADRHATIAWKKQLSADLDAIVAAYGAADKPADTIATAAAEIGIDRVRAIIATLTVYRVAMCDRRIGDDTAAWAQTIADALDADAAKRVGLITDAIHPAHLDQLARAAAEYVEPEIVTETVEPETAGTETAETAPAAEPETETTAETETAERAAQTINPMCAECVKRGASCPGTTCHSFTGCIYRETIMSAGSPTERSKTPAHITTASTAKLLDYWDYVRRLSYSAATALTRGWVLDELERRDPAGFARWLDSDDDSDYDATLRGFIRCDDAHVAWYAPQCDVAWCPGATREGAGV
uniref:Uncharacterized protein n=1 Tax=Siphoviridae sp. ctTDf8 TaxID=2825517 RepID=A0A8S5UJ42_9CAUD|nr:MAG TPA: Protein of unknown function (DUF3849) [Siphoviridae sp. ctTDf8]